jgi:hypothetical protein
LRDIGRDVEGWRRRAGRRRVGRAARDERNQEARAERPCSAEFRPDSECREPRQGGVRKEGNSNIFPRENGKERNLHLYCSERSGLVLFALAAAQPALLLRP